MNAHEIIILAVGVGNCIVGTLGFLSTDKQTVDAIMVFVGVALIGILMVMKYKERNI